MTSPMIPDLSTSFKNANGAWLMKPLFLELSIDSDKSRALYTLKPEDYEYSGTVYPSLRRLYLEMGDDTEYYFAEKYFGGWPHWKRLLQASWFVDYLTEYRDELRAKQIADAKARIREIANDRKDRGSLQANRLLLEETKKTDSPVGRPSKASIERRASEMIQDQSEIQEDLDRITKDIMNG